MEDANQRYLDLRAAYEELQKEKCDLLDKAGVL